MGTQRRTTEAESSESSSEEGEDRQTLDALNAEQHLLEQLQERLMAEVQASLVAFLSASRACFPVLRKARLTDDEAAQLPSLCKSVVTTMKLIKPHTSSAWAKNQFWSRLGGLCCSSCRALQQV